MSTVIDSMQLTANTVQEDMQRTERDKLLPRRLIRQILHRIRNGRDLEENHKPFAIGLKTIFETQFLPVPTLNGESEMMSWENFTFLWDVHPTEFLRVVTPVEWVISGGGFVDASQNGGQIYDPTAFTHQKV